MVLNQPIITIPHSFHHTLWGELERRCCGRGNQRAEYKFVFKAQLQDLDEKFSKVICFFGDFVSDS